LAALRQYAASARLRACYHHCARFGDYPDDAHCVFIASACYTDVARAPAPNRYGLEEIDQ
jgi:hypothetical protein